MLSLYERINLFYYNILEKKENTIRQFSLTRRVVRVLSEPFTMRSEPRAEARWHDGRIVCSYLEFARLKTNIEPWYAAEMEGTSTSSKKHRLV